MLQVMKDLRFCFLEGSCKKRKAGPSRQNKDACALERSLAYLITDYIKLLFFLYTYMQKVCHRRIEKYNLAVSKLEIIYQ